MQKYNGDVNLEQLKSQITSARLSLKNIREEFKDDQDLLDIYEPSAIHLVNELEAELSKVLSLEYGTELYPKIETRSTIDFWISLDGEEFNGGQGPIGQVGNFLTRLNNANKQAILVITEKLGQVLKPSKFPSLRLADTAVGSLKLGLIKPDDKTNRESSTQLDLFEELDQYRETLDTNQINERGIVSLDNLEGIEESELPIKGMQLLVMAIASVDDENMLTQLKNQYGSRQVIKLLHYAKELTPSNRSPIETVIFEGKELTLPEKKLITNKETRKRLTEHAKNIEPETEYIEGTAIIDSADATYQFVVARPLRYSNHVHNDVRCFFTKYIDSESMRDFFAKEVGVKGFIIYDRNKSKLLKLEIDDIWILDGDDE